MTRRLLSGAAAGAIAAALAGGAGAQTAGYVPGVAACDPTHCGYVLSMPPAHPGNNVVAARSTTARRASRATCATAPATGRRAWRSSRATRTSCRSRPPAACPAVTPAASAAPGRPRRAPAPGPRPARRAEDHARVEGAVRLRQGGAEARRQGSDRQRDHREAGAGADVSNWCSSPATPTASVPQAYNQKLSERRADAVTRLPGQQGRRRATRSRPSAWARRSRSRASLQHDGDEGTDRLPRAEPPRRRRGQGRSRSPLTRRVFRQKAPLRRGFLFAR